MESLCGRCKRKAQLSRLLFDHWTTRRNGCFTVAVHTLNGRTTSKRHLGKSLAS